ncbi:aldehyde dehydrogenase family protein [Candidatus Formimonas warabiya]|uniref:Aldehyde dehydrogenase n=1 Tax=Formimonas warabiya TaxID=1761012 RepID=A0A3G1KW00_FORW1|nr:aldehyde dehydrogenase family protein [Candidatus Formimonas warabiya]ATW26713.1 aldehyde dehydrogenase [Candidatus Formimonas warabiya]
MKMLIGGEWVNAKSGEEIMVVNPATQKFLDTVPNATKEDVANCLHHAGKGQKEWASLSLYVRTAVLAKCADRIKQQRDELATLLSSETGKTIKEAEKEISNTSLIFKSFAEKANHLYGQVMPDIHEGMEKDISFTRREPLGVIVCIVPFNFPANLFAQKVAPALACGNGVIVKPASDNPLTALRLSEILLECGVPGNALQIVTGKGSTVGKWLVDNPMINGVSLTGSTEVGMEIAKDAAKYLHRVFLELGGNDAFIIFEDADLASAVEEAVRTRAGNAGQMCCASKRFLVHEQIKEKFTNALVNRLSKLVIGDPLDPCTEMGCLISEKAAIQVEEGIKHTIEQGAKCIYGGKRFNKTFFPPTVLTDVTPEMDISKDLEVFGPVFPIIEFSSGEEAIRIANQTKYGLQNGIMSADISKAIEVASRLKSGAVVINGGCNYRHVEMPFGGCKMSGIGREGVSCTLEEMSQVKTYVLKSVLNTK